MANATPTPKSDTDTDSDSEPDELVDMGGTEQQFIPCQLYQLSSGIYPGDRANNRRFLRLFLTDQLAGPGNQERTIIRSSPAGLKNEQKKPELKALAFPKNPPFYVISNK